MTSLTEFVRRISSTEKCIDFLIEKDIFKNTLQCPRCEKQLTLNYETLLFRCYNSYYGINKKRKKIKVRCSFVQSVRKGTWFQNVRLPLLTAITFIAEWLWLSPPRYGFITDDLRIASHTFVDWSRFCREVCIRWCKENSTQVGGPNKVVEIDEAKFGTGRYNCGHLVQGKWIFGGYERDSKKIFIVSVEDRKAETLLNIIKSWILPGTTVMSECWKTYNCYNNEGYKELTENNSYKFVDPDTSVHTQFIERMWNDIRQNTSRYANTEEDLVLYFGEYLFKRTYSRPERIDAFFSEIAKFGTVPLESDSGPSTSSQ